MENWQTGFRSNTSLLCNNILAKRSMKSRRTGFFGMMIFRIFNLLCYCCFIRWKVWWYNYKNASFEQEKFQCCERWNKWEFPIDIYKIWICVDISVWGFFELFSWVSSWYSFQFYFTIGIRSMANTKKNVFLQYYQKNFQNIVLFYNL
jgi:hypothetical protein